MLVIVLGGHRAEATSGTVRTSAANGVEHQVGALPIGQGFHLGQEAP